MSDKRLSELTDDDYRVAYIRIEDVLIERRDRRISVAGRAHGMVVLEREGEPSDVIRLSTHEVMLIAIKAILEAD